MMKPTVLWIVGEPGLGKSTLARALIGPGEWHEGGFSGLPKFTHRSDGTAVAAGHYGALKFGGGDTVPYNGTAAWLARWETAQATRVKLTLLDGDRFSNSKVVSFFAEHHSTVSLRCVLLTAPEHVGQQRRLARSSTVQNAAWIKGRITKARRFFESFQKANRLELDAYHLLPLEQLEATERFLERR